MSVSSRSISSELALTHRRDVIGAHSSPLCEHRLTKGTLRERRRRRHVLLTCRTPWQERVHFEVGGAVRTRWPRSRELARELRREGAIELGVEEEGEAVTAIGVLPMDRRNPPRRKRQTRKRPPRKRPIRKRPPGESKP